MRKTVKINGSVEASTCASRGRQSRSIRRWSTAFLAVALGLATLGASASFVASTLQADEPREWKGRFGATVATGTLDLERTDAEFVAANAADPDVTRPKTVYFRDASGNLLEYNYAWLSPADRAEVDFALGLAAKPVETSADAEAPADETAEVASSQQATVTLVDGKPVLLLSGGASSAGVSAENSEVAWDAAPKAGTRKVLTVDGVEYAFRYCPAGTFTMGSPESEEGRVDDETRHEVTLTRGFWMLETEVTVEMWRSFVKAKNYKMQSTLGVGYNASTGEFEAGSQYTWANPSFPQTDAHPVTQVDWAGANAFCDWLSHEAELRIRLPSEAEWEYACRAGMETSYSFGSDGADLTEYGNVADASVKRKYPDWTTVSSEDGYVFTSPVKKFKPNNWNLYDMHGNVLEWCADWYCDYASGSQTYPGEPKSSPRRVLRGGGWGYYARYCRSASRFSGDPTSRDCYIGFRLVLGRELDAAPPVEDADENADDEIKFEEDDETSLQKSVPIKTEYVSGVVTFDGEPLANATVKFIPTDATGSQSYGRTNEKGEYKLQTLLGAPDAGTTPGEYKVAVDCIKSVPTGKMIQENGVEIEEMDVVSVLPARYGNPETSGLTATVVQGANTFNFELTTEAAPVAEEADPAEEAAPAAEEAPAA